MNTPTRDFLRRPEVVRRRSARQALAVIPDMAGLAVSPGEVVTLDANAVDSLANSRQGLQSWSPAPSPDELVIQKRGRRRKTIVWSPDVDARKRDSLFSLSSRDRTPVKSPTKSTITLRSTPRKRLMLGGDSSSDLRLPNTPEKQTKISNEPRAILPIKSETNACEKRSSHVATSIDELLKGMGNEKLVNIIMNLIAMQEKGLLSNDEPLRDVIYNQIFSNDLKPLEENLDSIRKNISDEISSSSGDESSYDRVADHLNAYQAALVSQGKILVKSQRWTAVMEYVFSAWAITKKIKPRLNNNGYDDLCRECFEALARFCITALECANFHTRKLEAYADRLENIAADREELRSCIQLIKEKFLSRTDK